MLIRLPYSDTSTKDRHHRDAMRDIEDEVAKSMVDGDGKIINSYSRGIIGSAWSPLCHFFKMQFMCVTKVAFLVFYGMRRTAT